VDALDKAGWSAMMWAAATNQVRMKFVAIHQEIICVAAEYSCPQSLNDSDMEAPPSYLLVDSASF